MRTRMSKTQRRQDILNKAGALFARKGLSGTEMEDIRLACGISRGGLYHHFPNKRAVLDALVEQEVTSLAEVLDLPDVPPIPALLQAGSGHLGNGTGILSALNTRAEKLDYLSALEQAFATVLRDALGARLQTFVRDGTSAEHLAELFLTITTHINRREILGDWTSAEAAAFAATALEALAPLLKDPTELSPVIAALKETARSP